MNHIPRLIVIIGAVGAMCARASGADVSQSPLADQMKALQESVATLRSALEDQQKQIDALKAENEALKSSPAPAPAAAPVSAPKAAQNSLPEIGAVLDIVAGSSESRSDEEGNDRLSARELELMLGYDVDPFTRFDAVVSFSDFEEASIEEAYVSYLGLPKDLRLKGGKFKPRAGKAIAIHRDQLDTVDEPLVIQRYFGAEGMSKAGLELSRYFPQFNDRFTQELVLGVIEGGAGEGGEMFGETRRRPSYYLHLKNYVDISDVSNIELGATLLRGSTDPDARDEVNALGLDLTYQHFFTPFNKFKWQTEFYVQDRRESEVFDWDAANAYVQAAASGDLGTFLGAFSEGPIRTVYDDRPWGMYSGIDYRLSPRFGVGGRFDYVEPVAGLSTNPRAADKGFAAYLTFYQSEFARLRLQYEHVDFASGGDDNRLYLQGSYAIGVHKHALK